MPTRAVAMGQARATKGATKMEKKYEAITAAISEMREGEALELIARLRAEFRPESHPGGVRLVEPGLYGWGDDHKYHALAAWHAAREGDKKQTWEAARRAADCEYSVLMGGTISPLTYRARVVVVAFCELSGYAKAYRGIEGLSREDSEGARINRGNEWIRLHAVGWGEGLQKVLDLLEPSASPA